MSLKLKEIEARLFDGGEAKPTDKEDLEYLIWLYQMKYNFYEKNPLYKDEKHREHLEGYRNLVIAARAALAAYLELAKAMC